MKLILLGDLAFTGIISIQPQQNKNRVAEIVPFLRNSDLVIANLETPLKVGKAVNPYKQLIHYSLLEPARELLSYLNIGCVSLANNHIYDCKMNGLKATIGLLDELGIYHTGAGWGKKHIEPVIINKSGIKIGFIAYVDKSTNPETENFPELLINYLDIDKVKRDVNALRNSVDKIICSIHWGVDYSYYPTPDQMKTARELVDSGVDVILGHHPHTLQPYECYQNGIIFYSLGTFIFGDILRGTQISSLPVRTKKGVIIEYEIANSRIIYQGFKIMRNCFLELERFDYSVWSRRKIKISKLKERWLIVRLFLNFEESFIDRFVNFFFGYYKTPLRTLLKSNVLTKIRRSRIEFNRLNNI